MSIVRTKQVGDFAAHKMVAELAKNMAGESYEAWATNSNEFYAIYPSQKEYIKAAWHLFVPMARTTLTEMLTTNINEDLKESIADALIKDNGLRYGREGNGPELIFKH